MWPLLLFSLCAIAVTIERGLFWFRIKKQERDFAKDILQIYRANPYAVFAKLKQHIDLPVSRIFLEALELKGASPNQFRLALESATQAELPCCLLICFAAFTSAKLRCCKNMAVS